MSCELVDGPFACNCLCWAIKATAIIGLSDPMRSDIETVGGHTPGHGSLEGRDSVREKGSPFDFWFSCIDMLRRDDDGGIQQVPGAILDHFRFQVLGYSGFEPSGSGSESVSELTLSNCEGILDELSDAFWSEAGFELYAAECCGFEFVDELPLVFVGSIKAHRWSGDSLSLVFGDRSAKFSARATGEFSGSGGLQGPSGIAGSFIPRTHGLALGVKPVLIDASRLIYRFHNGRVMTAANAGFWMAYDNGVPLTFAGFVPNAFSASPAPGTYVIDNIRGLLRIGSPPAGEIRIDAQGDLTGPIFPNATTSVEVLVNILTSEFGVNSLSYPADFDVASVARVSALVPWDIGYHLSSAKSMAEISDEIMNAFGGYWFIRRDGKISFDVAWDVGDEDQCIEIDQCDLIEEPYRETGGQPIVNRVINHSPNWSPYSSVSVAAQPNLDTSHRNTINDLNTASNLFGEDSVSNTLFTYEQDSYDFAAAVKPFFGRQRDYIQITVPCSVFQYEIGQCVSLNYPRYGVDGRNFKIIAIEETDAGFQTSRLRLSG